MAERATVFRSTSQPTVSANWRINGSRPILVVLGRDRMGDAKCGFVLGEAVADPAPAAAFFACAALTPPVQASSPPLQLGGFFFWLCRTRRTVDPVFQADAYQARPVLQVAKIWRPPLLEPSVVRRSGSAGTTHPGNRTRTGGLPRVMQSRVCIGSARMRSRRRGPRARRGRQLRRAYFTFSDVQLRSPHLHSNM
jgi:hypothetical protein